MPKLSSCLQSLLNREWTPPFQRKACVSWNLTMFSRTTHNPVSPGWGWISRCLSSAQFPVSPVSQVAQAYWDSLLAAGLLKHRLQLRTSATLHKSFLGTLWRLCTRAGALMEKYKSDLAWLQPPSKLFCWWKREDFFWHFCYSSLLIESYWAAFCTEACDVQIPYGAGYCR